MKYYYHRRSVDAEIATMRLIRSCTTIPVPRVLFQFRWLFHRYFIMDRLPGVTLDNVILTLSQDDAGRIQAQLRGYMQQLRNITRPPAITNTIASVIGGPFFCIRLHERQDISGPFRDQHHMNLQLRHERPLEDFPPSIQKMYRTTYPVVLTHNDFAVHNILVDNVPGIGWQVSAILDWETAAWLPSYWEYAKSVNLASRGSLESKRLWNSVWLPRIIEPFEFEAETDTQLGEYGYPKKHVP